MQPKFITKNYTVWDEWAKGGWFMLKDHSMSCNSCDPAYKNNNNNKQEEKAWIASVSFLVYFRFI